MKKVDISFNSTMGVDDFIIIEAETNSAVFKGVSVLTGASNEFAIGSSATESAENFYEVLNNYNALTGALGPAHSEISLATVSITFLDSSVTSANAAYYGGTSSIVVSVSDRLESYYNYDRQILTRSPHYYDVADPSGDTIDSAELHIFVYQGARYTDRPYSPTYVVRSSAILASSTKMTFNISEFARAFAEGTLAKSGNQANWTPFVDVFPFYTKGGRTYSLAPSLGIAYNGYGYFEQEVNPTTQSALAQSNNVVISHINTSTQLPVYAEKTSRVVFEKDGEVVQIENVTSDVTYSTSGIPFVATGSNFNLELNANENEFEYFDNEYINEYFFDYSDLNPDKAYIERTDGDIEVVDIRYISECKYEPIDLTFVNKFGALQSVTFFKNHSLSMKTDEESFRRNTLGGVNILGTAEGEYSTAQHQYKNLYRSGKQSISLNSGFYPEQYNEVFRQMMLSTDCWIKYNGKVLPVNISDSDINYKTSINDKLIEYSIKCDFAFDTINSIN